MMFLLNDTVLRLDGVPMDGRMAGDNIAKLSFPAILRMGQELFAAEPLLQRSNPDRARRLALLIVAKAPMINAALFVAPEVGCSSHQVTVRFVKCEFEVMAELYSLQREGTLDTVGVDRRIWRRLAA